ncbi:protein NUCLEOLAR COMPLEX ASSOCIATED 4-like [Arachis stenosperma]|uniref:protein NUCLEOLAR COMPLEX ASSOCIATED 4-like n=1 Tax=Arachis stenosperma TaxID=217475 RepID=UPI0025AC5164|nr:protein NUCLEOLAR COMPLEX ASSOCIATED 4-like [Arachis stenosperma]
MAPNKPKKNKNKKGRYGVAEIKTLGNDLLSSASNINNLPLLLNFVNPSSPPHHLLESLLSLHSFFLPLLPTLPSSSSRAADAKGSEHQSHFIYNAWLRSKFDELVKSLLEVLVSPRQQQEEQEAVKEVVLDTLMEFVKVANGGRFHSAIYHRFLHSIVHSESSVEFLVDLLTAKYFKYIDVRYFTLISLKKLATTLEGKDQSEDKSENADVADASQLSSSTERVIHNIYYTISRVPPFENSDNTSDLEMWSRSENEHKQPCGDVNADDKQVKPEKHDNSVLSAAKIAKKMKLKFTQAWLSFLRLPLPLDVYKEVLVNLHQVVIPHLSNPVMLCDFLTRSYDIGGVVSVMALSSLFILMTQYGLEYPNFYEKLYVLLVPSIFMAKHRARFFQLLDSCLKSPLLPAYLAASFAKKMSRLLLSIPPSGALVITALIHNILRRHPSINCLVHWEDQVDEGKGDKATDEATAANSDDAKVSASQKLGIDHFNYGEPNPKKSNAMRSSLWEVDTILQHYCPPVSRFALSLENDLTVRAKTSEVNVGDFSSGSYATIIGAEMSRRVKQVPLAFYKSTPSTLFSDADFAGWTFDFKDTSEIMHGSDENADKDDQNSGKRQRVV